MAPGPDLSGLANEIEVTQKAFLASEPLESFPVPRSSGFLLNPPESITTEFDALRFEAAAFAQLHVPSPDKGKGGKATSDPILSSLLISSPYNSAGHYLDLTELDISNRLFAKALSALKPVRADYATAPYTDSLNFNAVLAILRDFIAEENYEWKKQTFYVVIFRSKLKEVIDADLLYKLDYESHCEACESGGLLKYWFGKPDGERRNLATCFWRSKEDARLGGLGPWHKKARAAGHELYNSIVFSTHRFTILDGAQGLDFEDWV